MECFIFSSPTRHCLYTGLVYSFGRGIGEEEGRGFPLGFLVTGEQSGGERREGVGGGRDSVGSGGRELIRLCRSGN